PSSISTLSLHDALPIYFLRQVDFNGKSSDSKVIAVETGLAGTQFNAYQTAKGLCIAQVYANSADPVSLYLIAINGRIISKVNTVDRKSTRLNSSHVKSS